LFLLLVFAVFFCCSFLLFFEEIPVVAVAILAAGKGTRMKSDLPKVLHELGSKSAIARVLDSLSQLSVDRCLTIVGHRADLVRSHLAAWPQMEFVEQQEQRGTGHAVQQLLAPLADYEGDLLVLNGDVPLLRPETLANLLKVHQTHQNAATILTAQLANPQGYGRVFCDQNLIVQEIIEDRDCSPEQRQNCRINAGIYCFRWSALAAFLPQLKNDNSQGEYYLTDAIGALDPVMALDVADPEEIWGFNDRVQLAAAAQVLQRRTKEQWMRSGVTLIDPSSITIDDTVTIGPDAIIEPQTHLRGHSSIGAGARIGPGSLIENATIGDGCQVLYSVVTDSEIGPNNQVGPFAHVRGHASTGPDCRLGNFVELKNAQLGSNTKASHLSYLGDATLGDRVNIGAGTITANYDGVNKHRTAIGDRSKTGANTVLVAPVTIGQDVTIAAGSTVTEDVSDDALVIARSRQVVKPGWRLPSAD